MIANKSFSADDADECDWLEVKTQHRTPDFSVFFADGDRDIQTRSLPVIVEIKPYDVINGQELDVISIVMDRTRNQLQEQVYFAFDRYTMLNDIYVLCVVGWHWDILHFKRRDNTLPPGKYKGIRRKGRARASATPVDDHVFNPRHLLNNEKKDFSRDFKASWNMVMKIIGLTTTF